MSGFSSEASPERDLEARLLRIADVLIAATLLVFTLPLMIFAAMAIKLESSGPVLSRRPEVGRCGRQFTALRFRTTALTPFAEQGLGATWDRVARGTTRSGEFLQYSGIADLPLLVNVLRGDMTLVPNIPKIRRLAKWAVWVIVALVSGALFKGAFGA